MSNQYPQPGQPGEPPPTQVASGGTPPPGGYPQGGYPQGGYPQQPPGGAPYGANPGGYPPPGGPGGPGGYGAPPTGSGGGKKGLVIGIVLAVVVLVAAGIVGIGLATDWYGLSDSDDDAKPKRTVTSTITAETETEGGDGPTDGGTESDVITDSTAEDPSITAQAFFQAILDSDCLALEGLSTPEYFASEFVDQEQCAANIGAPTMADPQYGAWVTTENGDGSVTVDNQISDPESGDQADASWTLVPSGDTWLVDGFTFVEQ